MPRIMHDFSKLVKEAKFNDLSSELCFDNCDGHASVLSNKSSIWIVSNEWDKTKERIMRLCNVCTSNVDGVDDLAVVHEDYKYKGQLYTAYLPLALCEVEPKETVMYMNSLILEQLSHSNLIQVGGMVYYFMDVRCWIDNRITNSEKTVT